MMRTSSSVLVMAGLAMALVGCVTSMASDRNPAISDPAVRAAAATGLARAIVELRIPGGWRPEGELSPEGAARQHAAIASAQHAVITRLAGTSFRVLRVYDAVPMLSLEIGADAVAALEGMGDVVTRVHEDASATPQPTPAPPGSSRP